MRLLIADDSRVMRHIAVRTLRQAGFDGHEIVQAVDGSDALSKIETDDPDLVLSDWNMPNMSGLELLQALRSGGNTVPFGFATSEGSEQMRETAEQAGALFLIAKPFTPEAFQDALSPYLS